MNKQAVQKERKPEIRGSPGNGHYMLRTEAGRWAGRWVCCNAAVVTLFFCVNVGNKGKGKGSPYSITERRVLCSQRAGDVSHKPGGRLPLLSARPAVTPATLKRTASLLGEQRHDGCEQFA